MISPKADLRNDGGPCAADAGSSAVPRGRAWRSLAMLAVSFTAVAASRVAFFWALDLLGFVWAALPLVRTTGVTLTPTCASLSAGPGAGCHQGR